MGANDPIYTGYEPMSDALVAALTAAVGMTLADRTGGGILANPAIASGFIDKAGFRGALSAKLVDVAWGVDKFQSVAQGTNFTVYDLASDAATVTPARMGFARVVSDMARSLDGWGITDWANFAMDSTVSWQQTVVSTLAALFPSFTGSGGNTGGAATWAGMVTDYQTLGIANVPGPYTAVLRPKDWANIASDAMSVGGFVANDSETAAYKRAVNPGYKGAFLGGDLHIYTSQELPVSAGDTVSGMFGAGALAWDAHMPAPSPATIPLLWTPLFGVEIGRTTLKSEDTIASSTHLGASIRQGAAGVKMPFLT